MISSQKKNAEWLDKVLSGSYNKAINTSDKRCERHGCGEHLLQRDVHLLRVRQERAGVTPFKLPC